MTICKVCKVKQAHFGSDDKVTHCKGCKSPDMYDPYGKCIICKVKQAHYGSDGKQSYCKGCKSPDMYDPYGKCIICKKKRAYYGLVKYTHCIDCRSDSMIDIRKKNGGKIENNKKGCTKCGIFKDFSEYKNNNRQCIKCNNMINKQERFRSREDERYKIAKLLWDRLYHALNGRQKVDKTLNLLGCDIEFLQKFLSYQLKIRYNIDEKDKNIKYDLDHFIPCSSFDLLKEENQKKCFNWTNLQWLTNKENGTKGIKIPTNEDLLNREKLIQEFVNES